MFPQLLYLLSQLNVCKIAFHSESYQTPTFHPKHYLFTHWCVYSIQLLDFPWITFLLTICSPVTVEVKLNKLALGDTYHHSNSLPSVFSYPQTYLHQGAQLSKPTPALKLIESIDLTLPLCITKIEFPYEKSPEI